MNQQLPKDGNSYRIWSVVEDLVLERYDQLAEERMRDSYYLVREWLDSLRGDRILDAEFDYYVENYEYYRDDHWPRMEKRHGIRRPETKPPTVVIEDGTEYTEDHITDAWDRSRGFIFVEKSGMAADLSPLSEHGWLIVAAQGESTRTFREEAATDGTDRPILVVTDSDFYGESIGESIAGHSNRTEHLELWRELEDRVVELGLTEPDARALDLPRERDPTKSPDEWRTELNALTVLKERLGIDDPLLAYVAAKMAARDIPLAPLPVEDPERTVRDELRTAIEEVLADEIEAVVDTIIAETDPVDDIDVEGVGPLTSLLARKSGSEDGIDLGGIRDELEAVARDRREDLVWWRQSEYEHFVTEKIDREAVGTIASKIPTET